MGEGGGGVDVLIGRHPSVDELKEHHPAIISNSGQGLLSRGNKRDSNGGIASPAKRKKTFSNIIILGEKKLTVKTLIKVIMDYTRKARFVGLGLVHLGSEVASAQGMETK